MLTPIRRFMALLLFGLVFIPLNGYAGECRVTLPFEVQNIFKFSISSVTMTIEADGFSESRKAEYESGVFTASFSGLTPGTYTVGVSIKSKGKPFGHGMDQFVEITDGLCDVTARATPVGDHFLVIVDRDPGNSVKVDDFYDMKIDPENLRLKRYTMKHPEESARIYRESGMIYFTEVAPAWDYIDEDGVPILPRDGEYYRVPVQICHTAFGWYMYVKQKFNAVYLQRFFNNVDWLIENHDEDYYLYHHYEKRHVGDIYLEVPWISAMAQGEALSVMCMAYDMTKEERYLEEARGFFRTLYENNDTYWSFGIDEEDYYWLEEYPNKDFCHVLNGKMFAMWGLWDYYVITGDEFALALFEAGLASICDHYPIWNVPGEDGSAYCTHFDYSHKSYHPIHLDLINKYLKWVDVPELRQMADFFQNKTLSSVEDQPDASPLRLANTPNPFNASTTISFSLNTPDNVSVGIYSILGTKIRTIADGRITAGYHSYLWDGKNDRNEDVASGVYFIRVRGNALSETKKCMMLR